MPLPIMTATEPRLVMSIYSEHIVQSHRNMCRFGVRFPLRLSPTYHPNIYLSLYVSTYDPQYFTPIWTASSQKVKFNACNQDDTTFNSPHLPTTRLDRVHLNMFWLAFVTHEWDTKYEHLQSCAFSLLPSMPPSIYGPCMGPSDPTTRGEILGVLRIAPATSSSSPIVCEGEP